jgi:putative PEP-CTERM system TPR-repeat lipoprotein
MRDDILLLKVRPARRWRYAVLATAVVAFAIPAARAAQSPGLASQAEQYLKKGDFKSALIELRNAARQSPEDPKIRIELARLYLKLGDPRAAEIEARAARQRKGNEADYLPILADSLLRQAKFTDLLSQVRPGDRPAPIESRIRLAIGLAEAGLHNQDKAEANLRDAIRLDSKAPLPKIGLARLLVEKNRAEATALVDEVIATNPRLPDALQAKGELMLANGKRDDALRYFNDALKIDPNSLVTRLSRAGLYIDKGDYAAADSDLSPILKVAPDNIRANYLRALEDAKRQQYAAAEAILEHISPVFGSFWRGYYLQGAVKFALQEYAQSEDVLRTYVAHVPGDAHGVRMVALAALRQGGAERAIKYLQTFAAKHPADATMLKLLGDAYMAAGKSELALQQFKKAAQLAPENPSINTALAVAELDTGNRSEGLNELERVFNTASGAAVAGPTLVLSDLRTGRLDQAATAAASLVKQDQRNPLYQTLLGTVRVKQGDLAAAETAFLAALTVQPDFTEAARSLANLYLVTGRADAANKTYDGVLAKHPNDISALLGLAQVAITEQRWKEAEQYLSRARGDAPNNPGPGVALVNFYLLRHDAAHAKATAEQLSAQFPSNAEVLDAQGRAEIAAGDNQTAASLYKRAVEVAPNSAAIFSRYVAVLLVTKNFDQAQAAVQQAMTRNPRSTTLKIEAIGVEARAKGLDAALAKARSFEKEDPDSTAYGLAAARLLEKAGRGAEALGLLEKLSSAHPSDVGVAINLAISYNHAKEPAKAQAILETHIKKDPNNLTLRAALAALYLANKEYEAAIREYEPLAQGLKNDAGILNNLAWLYQHQGDLAKAHEFAVRALALAPGNGPIEDTLGWILLAQGDTAKALTYLTAANAVVPTDPNIQYHFAVALSRGGRRTDARTVLEKLLGSGVAFTDKGDAEKLLEQLKKG